MHENATWRQRLQHELSQIIRITKNMHGEELQETRLVKSTAHSALCGHFLLKI